MSSPSDERRTSHRVGVLVVLLALVAVWQGAIWIKHLRPYQLPTPWATLRSGWHHWHILANHALVTVQGTVLGLAASAALALALALLAVRWPKAERAILSYAVLLRTLPIVGVAPILTLMMGRGLVTAVCCVVVVTIFALLVATIEGLSSMPGEINELLSVYDTPFLRGARTGMIPSAAGSLVVGLRTAAPLAVLAALLSEWLTGLNGVGSLMVTASANRDTSLLWATCVVAALLALAAYGAAGALGELAGRRGYLVDVVGAS
jgi:ABC-type nitrate/sulfonate/bicarbonate transport system permease component